MEDYFNDTSLNQSKTSLLVGEQVERIRLSSKFNIFSILPGDIISIVFWKEALIYRFEGICFAIRKSSLLCTDVMLLLRNVVMGISVELLVSYYYNRIYLLVILNHKRKYLLYRKAKLYFVRDKFNRASKIKN